MRAWHLANSEERKSLCVLGTLRLGSHVDADASPLEVEMRLGLNVAEEAEFSRGAKRLTVDLPSLEPETSWQSSEELDPEHEVDVIRAEQRARRNDLLINSPNGTVKNEDDAGPEADADAEADVDGDGDADADADADGEMDVDDVEGAAEMRVGEGLQLLDDHTENIVTDADAPMGEAQPDDTVLENEAGLKTGSSDPALTSDPDKLLKVDSQSSSLAEKRKIQLRSSLAYVPDDATFFDMDMLSSDLSQLSTADRYAPLELPEIFPDLPIYQALFPSPGQTESIVVPKGDKKSEKKDKKAVEELTRADDMLGSKVVSVSTFMHFKPTLVSALQPAKRWRNDTWVDLDDTVVTGDDTPMSLEPLPDGMTLILSLLYVLTLFFWQDFSVNQSTVH